MDLHTQEIFKKKKMITAIQIDLLKQVIADTMHPKKFTYLEAMQAAHPINTAI